MHGPYLFLDTVTLLHLQQSLLVEAERVHHVDRDGRCRQVLAALAGHFHVALVRPPLRTAVIKPHLARRHIAGDGCLEQRVLHLAVCLHLGPVLFLAELRMPLPIETDERMADAYLPSGCGLMLAAAQSIEICLAFFSAEFLERRNTRRHVLPLDNATPIDHLGAVVEGFADHLVGLDGLGHVWQGVAQQPEVIIATPSVCCNTTHGQTCPIRERWVSTTHYILPLTVGEEHHNPSALLRVRPEGTEGMVGIAVGVEVGNREWHFCVLKQPAVAITLAYLGIGQALLRVFHSALVHVSAEDLAVGVVLNREVSIPDERDVGGAFNRRREKPGPQPVFAEEVDVLLLFLGTHG